MEMNKKILVILSFTVVIASISAVSASDLSGLSTLFLDNSENSTTISGINFTIPEGFTEIVNESVENEPSDNPYVDFNFSSKTFMSTSGDVIIISVSSSDTQVDDNHAKEASEGGNKTTINGVDGYEFNDAGFQGFTYAKDDKLVIMSAPDKKLFDDIVVA